MQNHKLLYCTINNKTLDSKNKKIDISLQHLFLICQTGLVFFKRIQSIRNIMVLKVFKAFKGIKGI